MKKLNALVSAISLGLTLSFAALPVASAHSTLNVGHSHTVHAHHKHTSKDNGKPYGETYRHHPANPCEKATIWPIPGNGNTGSTTISTISGTTGTPTTGTPVPVASFVAPSNCANTFDATISWLPTDTEFSGDEENFSLALTCQWFEDGTPVGQQFVENAPDLVSVDDTTITEVTPTIFSTSVYAPPKPSSYGYGYGRSSLDTFTLNCAQTVESDDNPSQNITSQVQVSGNDVAGLAGPQVYQPVYSSQFLGANAGFPGYNARHHVKVRH